MEGDISRATFRQENHYIGVGWQQGRPTTDADQNETQEILVHRLERGDEDTIGPTGVPKVHPGFALTTGAGSPLTIGAGHLYIDGILCENDADVAFTAQPHRRDVPDPTATLGATQFGLVYLDVFKRNLSYHDNPAIREEALNGVDTTTRMQVVWQAKILPLTSVTIPTADLRNLRDLSQAIAVLDEQIAGAASPEARAPLRRQRAARRRQLSDMAAALGVGCAIDYAEWTARTAPSTGTLTVTTAEGVAAADPCDVPVGGGYSRGENQFYRIQVHTVPSDGSRNGATFLFSRDNASIATRIEAVGSSTSGSASGTEFAVESVQRDDYLGIFNGDWVEYVDDGLELGAQPGMLAQVTNADANLNRITLDRSITVNLDRHPKLRKWDQSGGAATDMGIAMNTTDTPVEVENGLRAQFGNGRFHVGDYWHFAARASSGRIDFPDGAVRPFGVEHHYARLGIVAQVDGRLQLIVDCRNVFPPLTAITAGDVAFDNSACALPNAHTVQDALEGLCARSSGGGGSCSFTVTPERGWEAVFERIPQRDGHGEGGDAEICFPVGEFRLDAAVLIANRGHLTLRGSGPGTRIVVTNAEVALRFENCRSVTIRHLHAESRTTSPNNDLNGVLTICGCPQVTIDHVSLRCAEGADHRATCLTVRGTCAANGAVGRTIPRTAVRVQSCDLLVGHYQTGILLVDIDRAMVEDNHLRVPPLTNNLTVDRLVASPQVRATLRRRLVSEIELLPARVNRIGADPQVLRAGGTRTTVTVRGHAVRFTTERELANEWQRLVNENPPAQPITSAKALLTHIMNLADRALRDQGTVGTSRVLRPWFAAVAAQNVAAAYQGIVVGGQVAQDVRLVNNTIEGAMQGIRVGVSHRESTPGDPDYARTVLIANNTVAIVLPPIGIRLRHGLFVGNCQSLVVENNYFDIARFPGTQELYIEGIRVWGHIGQRLLIRQNHLVQPSRAQGFDVGIRVHVRNDASQPQWLVADNVATVQVNTALVRQRDNFVS